MNRIESPSVALYAAALAGLLGAACSKDESHPAVSTPDAATVTSTVIERDMTQEKFTALCDERGGAVEVHPHCGGANTCKGFSWDDSNFELTEHTCKGLNTCAGFSCVVPDT